MISHKEEPRSIRYRNITQAIVIVALLLISGCRNLVNDPSSDPSLTAAVTDETAAWYGVYFTDPESTEAGSYRGGPAEELVEAIESARLSVDVAAYAFNLWGIRDALLDAHQRGLRVRMVTDSDNILEDEVQELVAAGIPVVGDRAESLMHDKFFIIDRLNVFTGSMNPTVGGAYYDNNNLVRIRDVRLAESYTDEFEEMFLEKTFSRASPADKNGSVVSINGTHVEIYFSPEGDVAKQIVKLIENSTESIYFLAYSFTSDDIAGAMIDKARDGVRVAGVMERSQYNANTGTEFNNLRMGGIDVLLDDNSYNMHHKVIIIDEKIVITGSYNFSRSAEEKNDENVIIIHSPEIAALFLEEFGRIYKQVGE